MKRDARPVAQSKAAGGSSGQQGAAKRVHRSEKRRSSSPKIPRGKAKKKQPSAGIREAQEARALLEEQLNGLYWWVFNAYKIKGFTGAKAADQVKARESEARVEASRFDERTNSDVI